MCSKEKRISFGVIVVYLLILSCLLLLNFYLAKIDIEKTKLVKNKYQLIENVKSKGKDFHGDRSIFTPFDKEKAGVKIERILKNVSSLDEDSHNNIGNETNIVHNDGTKKQVQTEEKLETDCDQKANIDKTNATQEISNETNKLKAEKKDGPDLSDEKDVNSGEVVKSFDTTDLVQCMKQTSHSVGTILDDSTLYRLLHENCEVEILKGSKCYKIYPKKKSEKTLWIHARDMLSTDQKEKEAEPVLHSGENYNKTKVVKSVTSLLQCMKQAKMFGTMIDDIVLFRSLYETCDITILAEEHCYKIYPKRIQQHEN